MPMTTLRFLADMNLSPLTVQALQAEGIDIIRVSDVLPAATSDTAILAFARQTGRVIITQDLDFSTLIAISGHTQPSLITLRLSSTTPAVVTQKLRQVLPRIATALDEGSAITVDERNIRIRKLPIR